MLYIIVVVIDISTPEGEEANPLRPQCLTICYMIGGSNLLIVVVRRRTSEARQRLFVSQFSVYIYKMNIR